MGIGLSSKRPKPGITKDMAKYVLLLQKMYRRIIAGDNEGAGRVADTINREYSMPKQEMYHQLLCDYAYGED